MVDYFNRRNDREQVQTAIKGLYGVGIRKEQDPSLQGDGTSDGDGNSVYETYVKQDFDIQVDAGMVETLSIGFGARIVNAKATMFTEEGNRFTLTHDSVEDVDAADELLAWHRKQGGHKTALVRADKLSIQCGSSAILTSFSSGSLRYQHLSPDDVRVFFADTIEEDGVIRATDRTDIEEASLVIIRLGQVDLNLWNYLAIYGRSDEYPDGRWVTYQSSDTIEVPNLDNEQCIDYEIDGHVANPMSYWANQNPDENIPEYPICVIYSGLTESCEVLPTTTSLYNADIEFSRAASHTLSKSQEAAAGTIAITTNEVAQGKPLPRTLCGHVHTIAGQDIKSIPHDSAACLASYEILRGLMVDAGASYSVPDYMIADTNSQMNREADSGIALQIKTRPLKKDRQFRISENRLSIDKMFNVEKAQIAMFADDDESAIALLSECEQEWDAGELRLPENKKEVSERLISLLDKGIIDTIAAIREYYQLQTDTDAIDVYEKMAERKKEYPPLAGQEEKKPVGLLRKNGGFNGQGNNSN
jgi:hypothetical protein